MEIPCQHIAHYTILLKISYLADKLFILSFLGKTQALNHGTIIIEITPEEEKILRPPDHLWIMIFQPTLVLIDMKTGYYEFMNHETQHIKIKKP